MTTLDVVLIDDDEAWCCLVEEAFRRAASGGELHVIPEPARALSTIAAAEHRVAVLLDLNLARTHGLELLHRIRDVSGDRNRVVVMSSSVARKDRLAVEAFGATFVTKPTSFGELCTVVAALVDDGVIQA